MGAPFLAGSARSGDFFLRIRKLECKTLKHLTTDMRTATSAFSPETA